MNELDRYRAALLGAVVATFFLSMFYVFTTEDKPQEPQKPQSNFEVVDTYKGCDIVRYTNPNFANYQYFLDCRK